MPLVYNQLDQIHIPLLKLIGDSMSDCAFLMKVSEDEFIYEYMNEAGYELARLNPTDLGYSLIDCLPESEASFLSEQYRKVLQFHHKISYKDTVVFPNVQYLAETTLLPLIDNKSEITHIFAITKNLSMYTLKSPEVRQLNRIFSSYTENTEEAFALFNVDFQFLRINESFYRIFGYQKSELYDMSWFDIQPHVREDFFPLLEQLKQGARLKRFECQLKRKNSEWITASIGLTAIADENGYYTSVVMILEDITKQVDTKRQLEESEERYRLIADYSQDLIKIIDINGMIQYASPSHKHVLGYHPKDLVGENYTDYVCKEDHAIVEQNSTSKLTNTKGLRYELRLVKKDSSVLWVETRMTPVKNQDGSYSKIVLSTREITKRKRAEDEWKRLAYTDDLTGLTNRRMFEEYLTKTEQNVQNGSPERLALLYLDGDQFKQVNDEFGHKAGDELLVLIGQRIRNAVRQGDVVSRIGGDEFAVLLPKIETDQEAEEVAKRIIERINQPFQVQDYTFTFSCSLGISIYPDDADTVEKIQIFADRALYEAKNRGKSRHVFYSWL
ncbi:bifunctional diguanylate cyclase/phosphodiesterase [Halobacillus seohaensis]|uniref:Diguanylate cyclase domain-containing protein n=1 Tax=Halobacillus seohaensis TaxID=447421 RepID=A0ABW2EGF4_9BACI